MAKNLVIVESPAKAKTINKILGADFKVTSCLGHVRDLPVASLGVDIEKDFRPKYVISKDREKVIGQIKKDAAACETIYLAPDPDREGEAIAWHIQEILKPAYPQKQFVRVQYNEITPTAVRKAFAQPGELNLPRVDAQQARRILDRIVGYKCSPMLWRRIRKGLSAGRVQSVALRLVCEREQAIRSFVPVPYWVLGARVHKQVAPKDPFVIRLQKIDGEKAEVAAEDRSRAIQEDLTGRELKVIEIARKEVSRKPFPPLITSTLQQAGSTFCGYSPARTMAVAQQLYEGIDLGEGPVGLITYMRTDSFAISADALGSCREMIARAFGDEYVPEKPNFYRSRASAQEAHECIRPTDVTRTPESLEGRLDAPQMKVYRLIWQRFVASQMAPARIAVRTARVDALPLPGRPALYTFGGSASDVVFPGYMKVTGQAEPKSDDEEEKEDGFLPPLAEGESLDCIEWLNDRKETKPPSRFSQASLIRELEGNGVGRPSTYAQIIETLQDRRYVTVEKRMLTPTDLGMQVSDLLVQTMGELFNVQFTASMEERLDRIEEGQLSWIEMLKTFYVQFEGWLAGAKLPAADAETVDRALALMEPVTEWGPETKRGKRTFSDKAFYESLKEQVAGGKGLSPRQLDSLLRLAARYRAQIPGAEAFLKEAGKEEFLAPEHSAPPAESSRRKLALLAQLDLDDRARSFVESLTQRTDSGRGLTGPQSAALNKIVMARAAQIENFDAIRGELDLIEAAPATEDKESGPLLGAMQSVKEWQAPVQRGKRTFDDKAFYESLKRQFEARHYLTPKQIFALKKLTSRYREQIPEFEQLKEAFGLKVGGGRGKGSKGEG